MKKFAKILVVALTVCLIVGVMAVTASAAALIPKEGSYTDLEAVLGNSGNASKNTYCCYSLSNGIMTNGAHNGASHSANCTSGGALYYIDSINNFKYMTLDFDFCATNYLEYDEVNSKYIIDEDGDGGRLSYSEYVKFSFFGGSTYVSNYPELAYFVVDNNGNWFVSADKIKDDLDIALATEKNVTNHFTLLDNGSQFFVFINGEFVVSYNYTFNTGGVKDDKTHYGQYNRIGFSSKGFAKEDATTTDYSIKMSNGAYRVYTDYVSGDYFGIDDYLRIGDYNMNLYTCVDTYYNQKYTNSNLATFTYKSFNSDNIRTGLYDINKALTYTENIDLDNSWYDMKIISWKLEEEGEITAGETYTLVPDKFEAVAEKNISYKANVTLLDQFTYNLYVKKIDGVKNVKIGGEDAGTKTLSDGVYYTGSSAPGVYYALANPTTIKLTCEVEYNGSYYPFSADFSVSIKTYFQKGMEQYSHEDNPLEVKLLVNFLNYAKAAYEHRGITITGGGYEWVQTEIDKHTTCGCLASEIPSNEGVTLDHTGLSGYAYSFHLAHSSGSINRVGFALYVPTDSDFKSAEITITGIASDNSGEYKTGQKITIPLAQKAEGTQTVKIGGVDKKCYVYYSNNGLLAIYNVNEIFTLNVTNNDDSVKSGTFNLVEYIEALEAKTEPTANESLDLVFVKQLYLFGVAAKEYKTDGFGPEAE